MSRNRTKTALCVGINAYLGAPLNGCVNDANDWADALAGHGYSSAVLLDQVATKAVILENLKTMVADARYGDRLVFTYSGHGTWLPDDNTDEPDARDEALVAYDYLAGGLIRDDELADIFSRKRFGVRLTMISDSCFSGSVNRMVNLNRGNPRYISPFTFLEGDQLERARDFHMKTVTDKKTIGSNVSVLFSGSSDTEYSYDAWINGRANGAFSATAIRALDTFEPGSPSYARWFRSIRQELPSKDYGQSPQLSASMWQRTWSL